jgi:predicted secreted protein
MKIEIPKYNYTKDQLEQLRSLLSQYEFDTPENRELVENVANNFLSEIIQQSRDEKINLIL